jgi:NTE family protein
MKQIRLALSGSGFLAPIHIGAICALMDNGVEIIEIAGTSGGSIAAALVAIGKTSQQLKSIALEPLPDGILAFNFRAMFAQGYCTGDVMHQWLLDVIGDSTFAATKIPVSIIATDIDAGEAFEFDAVTTPTVALYDACRASASIPFIYSPAIIGNTKYCDGGMCENLPVKYLVDDAVPRLAIRVMSGNSSHKTDTLLRYAGQCINTLLDADEDNLAQWATQAKAAVIPVDASPYSFLNCTMALEQKLDLFNRGYDSVGKYLTT